MTLLVVDEANVCGGKKETTKFSLVQAVRNVCFSNPALMLVGSFQSGLEVISACLYIIHLLECEPKSSSLLEIQMIVPAQHSETVVPR
jgi:hypothetical protein